MAEFTQEMRERLMKLATTNVSDAMDAVCGYTGACKGIDPLYDACRKMVGPAVTQRFIPTDHLPKEVHGGMKTIAEAAPGSVIVVDGGGTDISTCGGIAATNCVAHGISGWVSNGLVRDVDEIMDLNFPMYCAGRTIATARGRSMECAPNQPISVGGVVCRPGDIVLADHSGVVIIPVERLEEIVAKAEEIAAKEDAMIAEVLKGTSLEEIDKKSDYEHMLSK